jgi:hypothetical protein
VHAKLCPACQRASSGHDSCRICTVHLGFHVGGCYLRSSGRAVNPWKSLCGYARMVHTFKLVLKERRSLGTVTKLLCLRFSSIAALCESVKWQIAV